MLGLRARVQACGEPARYEAEGSGGNRGSPAPANEAATAQLQVIFTKKKCRSNVPEYSIFQGNLENLAFMCVM